MHHSIVRQMHGLSTTPELVLKAEICRRLILPPEKDTYSPPLKWYETAGHLFCWPCLYRWIVGNTSCPVCKDHIDQNRLIPIYCRQQPSTASPADLSLIHI